MCILNMKTKADNSIKCSVHVRRTVFVNHHDCASSACLLSHLLSPFFLWPHCSSLCPSHVQLLALRTCMSQCSVSGILVSNSYMASSVTDSSSGLKVTSTGRLSLLTFETHPLPSYPCFIFTIVLPLLKLSCLWISSCVSSFSL